MEEAEEPGGGKLQEDTGQFGLGSRTSVRTSVHEARDAQQDELLRNEPKGAKFRLADDSGAELPLKSSRFMTSYDMFTDLTMHVIY